MRIQRNHQTPRLERRTKAAFTLAAEGPAFNGRVCGDMCTKTCAACGSTRCQCLCSPACTDAPYALSSDPDAYPIEPGITGLVYAMTRSGLFETCWSCEGHPHLDGSAWKVPTVWFYCNAVEHARLLADGIARLSLDGVLKASWQVTITYSDPDNPRTTFSLAPVLVRDEPGALGQLQRDIAQIALALPQMLVEAGKALLRA